MLIVNTAMNVVLHSKVYRSYMMSIRIKRFIILGFPCNQFGGQEPGSGEEAAQNCKINYGVTFPIHEKVDVKGDNQHPLFHF